MRPLIAPFLLLCACVPAAAEEPLFEDCEAKLREAQQKCPLCNAQRAAAEKPGVVRLVSPPFVAPAPTPFLPPPLRPGTPDGITFDVPADAKFHVHTGFYPFPPPPGKPPTDRADAESPPADGPEKSKPRRKIHYRSTRVFRLTNQPAAEVAGKLKALIGQCAGKAAACDKKVLIAPEAATNRLIISAPPLPFELITRRIQILDREPTLYRVALTIARTDPKSGKRVISSPKIVTSAGKTGKAKVTIGEEGGGSLEITAVITEMDAKKPEKSEPKPKNAASKCPQPFDVFTAPKPQALRAKPRTAPTAAAPVPTLPDTSSEEPGRIRLTGGAFPAPVASAETFTVRTYPIGDFLPRMKGKTLVEFVRAAVHPKRWNRDKNPSTVIYFKATKCLVVRAHDSAHDQIAELLGQLRKNRKPAAKGGEPRSE